MAKLTHTERSKISRKAWKQRKPEGICSFCHKPVWVRGLKRNGKLWHNECWDRSQIVKVRKSSATRGFYKK